MPEISRIQRKNVLYDIKDETARSLLKQKYTKPVSGIPMEDLSNEVRDLLDKTGTPPEFIETDPTVPDWAKSPQKPTYTASEVGALPDSTVIPVIPANISAFTNDAGYLTQHQDISGKVDKETGKGLSTNDYTTAEKEKLAGIAAGAEVNVQSDWNQTDSSAVDYIKNKPTIPASVVVDQSITENGTNPVQGGAIYDALQSKMERFFIRMSEDDDTLTFTDFEDNELTHAQVREILNNPQNDVWLDFAYGLPVRLSYTETDYWVFTGVVENTIIRLILLYDIDEDIIIIESDYAETILTDENSSFQEQLESGVNIKTINGQSVLGSGNLPTIIYGKRTQTGFVSGVYRNSIWKFLLIDISLVMGVIYYDVTTAKAYTYDGESLKSFYYTDESLFAYATDISNVGYSGDYDDLLNKPTISRVVYGQKSSTGFKGGHYANGNWMITIDDISTPEGNIYFDVFTSKAYTHDGQSLKEVGFNGNYNDLLNKPTIPAAQVQSDWNATSGMGEILNKPTIPTVPTNVSSFTNDAGYLTAHQDISGKADVVTKVTNTSSGTASLALDSGKFYVFSNALTALTITALNAPSSGMAFGLASSQAILPQLPH